MTYTVAIRQFDDPDEFRGVARRLLLSAVAPSDIVWATDAAGTLFADLPPDVAHPSYEKPVLIPRAFATVADSVICNRNESRWSLLYEALWRITQGERWLMDQPSDPLVHRLHQMAASVRRDIHRMTAFVRFRSMPSVDPADEDEHFIAWYEPQHHVLRRASGFFIDRFASMRFSILTPDLTLHWNRTEARFAPGLRREDAVSVDAVEEWWCRYYASIFNPARINAPLMRTHMPSRFWHNLPEAAVVLDLIEQARSRTSRMIHSSMPSNQDAP